MSARVCFAVTTALVLALSAALVVAAGPITLTTTDGVKLAGNYLDSGKPDSKGLILLHMMGGTWQDWGPLAEPARQRGYCSVAVTLRGHGKSVWTTEGRNLNRRNFSNAQFAAMINDVEAVYQYLIAQENVDKKRIAIIGASIGANLAVKYAAEHPDRIRGVVLLSPGLRYRGIETKPAVKAFGGQMLFYAGSGDEYSARSVAALGNLAGDRGAVRYYPGGEHGTRLFAKHPEMIDKIIKWLNAYI